MKFIKGARNWRWILGTQTVFLASDPPSGKTRLYAVACRHRWGVRGYTLQGNCNP